MCLQRRKFIQMDVPIFKSYIKGEQLTCAC